MRLRYEPCRPASRDRLRASLRAAEYDPESYDEMIREDMELGSFSEQLAAAREAVARKGD